MWLCRPCSTHGFGVGLDQPGTRSDAIVAMKRHDATPEHHQRVLAMQWVRYAELLQKTDVKGVPNPPTGRQRAIQA